MATRATIDTVGTKYRRFNDHVRGELKRRKIHQEVLADYLGVTRATLTYSLNGQIEWYLKDALKTAEFFEVGIEEIM